MKRPSTPDNLPYERLSSEKRPKYTIEFQKHPQFWDKHGNVVVQVENMLFRIHGPNLTRHSEFVSAIFNIKAEKYYEGVPLHCFLSVNARDFESLLFAIDNALIYLIESPTFEAVASILRASTVLQFPKLREFAASSLISAWPIDLDQFSTKSKWLKNAAETVRLARTCDVPSVLKRALFELLRTPGFTEDDTDAISNSDLRLLVKARERVTAAWISAVLIPQQPCIKAKADCRSIVCDEEGINSYTLDPISGLALLIDGVKGLHPPSALTCSDCIEARIKVWKTKRARLWSDLDEWLELEL